MVEQTADAAWYAMGKEEVLQRLKASGDGLVTSEAEERLSQVGPNALDAGEGAIRRSC